MEEEGKRNINVWLPLAHPLLGIWPATQACALTGNQTGNALVHRPTLSPVTYTNQCLKYYFKHNFRKFLFSHVKIILLGVISSLWKSSSGLHHLVF